MEQKYTHLEGDDDISPDATSERGNIDLHPSRTSVNGDDDISPAATSERGNIDLHPSRTSVNGDDDISPAATSERGNIDLHPSRTSVNGDDERSPDATSERGNNDQGCRNTLKKGTLLVVVLGVVVLAILVSIMLVNWARLIYKEEESNNMVLIVLLVTNALGMISVCLLGYLRSKQMGESIDKPDTDPEETHVKSLFGGKTHVKNPQKIAFVQIKLLSMFFFGLCYIFHCCLYAWKHSSSPVNYSGVVYNIITIIYAFSLFIFFSVFHGKKYKNNIGESFFILIILISNVCIWLDTLFSESDYLFKTRIDNNNNESDIHNATEVYNRAEDAIEKTDPFLSPAMIEFSLLSIDMLFSNEVIVNEDNQRANHTKNLKIEIIKIVFQHFIFIASFALFGFTLTVVLTTTNLDYRPGDYLIYVGFQLALKVFIFALIGICIYHVGLMHPFHFSVWAFVLIISCFGNIVYHMFNCFALHSKSGLSVTVSWVDNIISILIAGLQTFFILGNHSPLPSQQPAEGVRENNKTDTHTTCVYYLCSLLSMMNLGLWVSDSIGEERLPVFSIELYEAYDLPVWIVINKLILPLTIFFRFHTGLDFLKMYWERY